MAMELRDSAPRGVGAPGPTPSKGGRLAAETPPPAVLAGRRGSQGRWVEAAVVRILDVAVATATLIILSPVLLMIALAVRATSSGPALFRQERLGKDMRTFLLYKFRTMRPDAIDAPHRTYIQALMSLDHNARKGNLFKLVVDDRITPIGRFLRSWSLDEVPQLVNVLRGEMSLVGPRPVIGYEAEMYPEPYLRRFSVNRTDRPVAGERTEPADLSRDGSTRSRLCGAAIAVA